MKKMLVDAVTELNEEKVIKLLNRCIAAKISKREIWRALNDGLNRVGTLYEEDVYSIADLMVVGMIFEDAMERTNSCSLYDNIENDIQTETVLVGTVEGDIHDIGKTIFKGALNAGGFLVKDIGVDVPPQDFVASAIDNHCRIIGLSVVLSNCIPAIKKTIEAFKEAGIRQDVKIIIGGNVTNQEVMEFSGADAYTDSAIQGLKICQNWVKNGEI